MVYIIQTWNHDPHVDKGTELASKSQVKTVYWLAIIIIFYCGQVIHSAYEWKGWQAMANSSSYCGIVNPYYDKL